MEKKAKAEAKRTRRTKRKQDGDNGDAPEPHDFQPDSFDDPNTDQTDGNALPRSEG
jgi:hypothetical protein